MYLARFTIDDQDYVQLAVRIGRLPVDPAGLPHWQAQARELARSLLDVPHAWVTQRLSLSGSGFSRHWLATVPARAERSLARWHEQLRTLEPELQSTFSAVKSRAEHDSIFADVPQALAQVCTPVYRVPEPAAAGAWLSQRSRAPDADGLLRLAWLQERDVLLQSAYSPLDPDPEVLRELRKNEVRLEHLRGAPSVQVRAFVEMMQAYGRASHRGRHWVGAAGQGGAQWTTAAIRKLTAAMPLPPECDDSEPALEGIDLAIDLSESGPFDAALGAADADEIVESLAWVPKDRPLQVLSSLDAVDEVAAGEGPASAAAASAHAPAAGGRFVFVSYCRRDMPQLTTLLDALHAAGVSAWWDRDLAGGSEWLRVLEQKLESSDAVVVLLSDEACRSRFVQNELTYAHIQGKPVIAVRVGSGDLPQGLRIILAHRHWLQLDPRTLPTELRKALPG